MGERKCGESVVVRSKVKKGRRKERKAGRGRVVDSVVVRSKVKRGKEER